MKLVEIFDAASEMAEYKGQPALLSSRRLTSIPACLRQSDCRPRRRPQARDNDFPSGYELTPQRLLADRSASSSTGSEQKAPRRVLSAVISAPLSMLLANTSRPISSHENGPRARG